MYKNLRVGAIIAAAGKSSRMGNINKLFIKLGRREILAEVLNVFSSTSCIDSIVIVCGEDTVDRCRKDIVEKYSISKVSKIIPGGAERQFSVLKGLIALYGMCDIVLIHDGARPFVREETIKKSVEEAYIYGAAACAVPVKDTIKIVDSDKFTLNTPDRNKVYAVQTPQAFKYNIIYDAHIKAKKSGFIGTDDTMLVERAGSRVKLFEGSYDNIKITTPDDIYIAEAIIKHRNNTDF
ncbi:MAG: 2-C-methyl-D-erythritol 4-phosphate cytidylyltransferase [Clostridiales bacterium]|nr:2-C-methyl-D-erythritol 4-phosphate cytidylyltransferase [Clostridiales bacterium]HBM80316.1 2-C-methyl-D-erythritol 4-phosphate cytidylyltransferase [Clostridiaceae bacterium]